MFKIPVRYKCRECGWIWSRVVQARTMIELAVPFLTVCPGCTEEAGS